MKCLQLKYGEITKLDDDDYERYSVVRWEMKAKRYAGRWDPGIKKNVLLHRLINKTPKGYDTDHINGDKLDNRKRNLRTVTRSQNMSNTMQQNNTSGYRGVSWHKQRSKWAARAKVNGRYKSLGLFDTPEEASRVYNDVVAQRFA